MADVFISYSRKDGEFVHRLGEALAKRGKEPWVDSEAIPLTAEWRKEIYAGIRSSHAFAFVISPDSVASEVCQWELEHANTHNKRLVPIVRRNVQSTAVPESLESLNWIFFRDDNDFDKAVDDLVEALDTDLDWRQAHTRLDTRAEEWKESGEDSSFLLRGSDLQAAEEWQARSAEKEPKPTDLQARYIAASRGAATRRKNRLLAAVTLGMVVAVLLGIVALLQRNEAVAQRNEAIARQLSAQSNLVRNQESRQLERSVLLAAESMQRHPSLEADQALRGGLALLVNLTTRVRHEQDSFVEDVAFSRHGGGWLRQAPTTLPACGKWTLGERSPA